MWSSDCEVTLNNAYKEAQEQHHEFVTVEHLLLALLDNEAALKLLRNAFTAKNTLDASIGRLKKQLIQYIQETTPVLPGAKNLINPAPTAGFQRVLQRAYAHVQTSGKSEVTAPDVLVAIFSEKDSQSVHFLVEKDITRFDLISYISHGDMLDGVGQESEEMHEDEMHEGIDDDGEEPKSESFEAFVTNLNEMAKKGRIDPLVGRAEELNRVLQVLARRKKNNPLLVGESGVGKTAIAEGLAQKIVEGKVPEIIADSVVFSLDMGSLLAGTRYRGDFEKRFKTVLDGLEGRPGAVLFIDEIHTVIGAGAASGGVMDASNLLKPMLSSNQWRCMGSTTYQEYRGIFEKDRALSRRFQKVDIKEPSVNDTYLILKGLRSSYESHYGIRYTARALKEAATLSARHIKDRFLPDKAIDVIDEAGAAQKLLPKSRQRKQIGVADIEATVAKLARIPPARVNMTDRQALMDLNQKLKLVIFGQDKAVETLSGAIKLSRSGLKPPKKPIGSFLFSGPTGVGKTEISRQLAYIMGMELLRYDMSEYMERHTVSRLIGAPPGYVGFDQGGLLTEAVIKHPHAILLLDEIEKAHPDVFNLLLQVMDYGTLTDNNGRQTDFSNVVLIMTTNVGATSISRRSVGFSEQNHASEGSEAINKWFTPEFRNRLDNIIQFNALQPEVIINVVDKLLNELQASLDAKGITLHVDKKARHWLAKKGYDPKMGARPMQRLIQDMIKHRLADDILFGNLAAGGDLYVSVKKNSLHLKTTAAAN